MASASFARDLRYHFLQRPRMNWTRPRICGSLKLSPHAGMTVERPALDPPLLMILKRMSSESFAILLQSVKSAGFGSKPWELGPSPLPPMPWHTEQVSLKIAAASSAADHATAGKFMKMKRMDESRNLLMKGSMA
jgi:hypothetical protein